VIRERRSWVKGEGAADGVDRVGSPRWVIEPRGLLQWRSSGLRRRDPRRWRGSFCVGAGRPGAGLWVSNGADVHSGVMPVGGGCDYRSGNGSRVGSAG